MRLYLIAYYTGHMFFAVGPFWNDHDLNKMEEPHKEAVQHLSSFACELAKAVLVRSVEREFVNDPKFNPDSLLLKCEVIDGIPDLPGMVFTPEELGN